MSARRPLWLHLTSFAFGAASHPGIHRCVLGLAPHGENVVLHWGSGRYGDAPAEGTLPGLARSGVFDYPLPGSKLLKKPLAVAHLLAGLRRRHGRPAAVVAHFGNNGWRGLPLAAWADVPLLTLFHGEDAARRVASADYAEAYRLLFQAPAARFLAVAAHLAESLQAAGAPAEAVAVHHLGVPLPAMDEPPQATADGAPASEARALRVALVGRLLPVKGHALALQAMARLRDEGVAAELHCFGDGPDADALQGRRAALGLEGRVFLHGNLPGDALEKALREMDAVVQPSVTDPDGRAEGLPNGLLEAMALGLPAVGSRHGGIPEAIVEGETGLLVPEGDAAALAAALARLARDPEERRRMGVAGRARVQRAFSLEGQGARLAEALRAQQAAYAAIPVAARRRAWAPGLAGLAERRGATGRREQLRWLVRIARNRVAGRIP